MLAEPKDLLTEFPVKKNGKQKKAFRGSVLSYFQGQGYACGTGPGWVWAGDPEQAGCILCCSEREPSGAVALLEIARTLPENHRKNICFLVFGGSAERWRYFQGRKSEETLVLHLGDVHQGDHIRLYPTKKLKEDRRKLTSLYFFCGYFGKKDILVEEKGKRSLFWPGVPYGVKIAVRQEKKKDAGPSKTDEMDQTNINLLRAALSSYISPGGIKHQ